MLPLCGVFGFCTLAGALAAGASYVLLDVFDAEPAAELIREHRVTHTNGSDEMFKRLLEHDTGTLREGGFAAFNLEPRPLIDAADARGLTLYQCYGTSEMQALVAHAPADAPAEERARAGGRPYLGRDPRRIVDDEIQVRGPNVMAGYLTTRARRSPTTASTAPATSAARPTSASSTCRAAATRCASVASSCTRARSSRSWRRSRASRPRRWSSTRGGRSRSCSVKRTNQTRDRALPRRASPDSRCRAA